MITFIYKSRIFRSLVYFIIVSIFSGCTSQFLIKDYGSSDIDLPSVTKAYLNDGKTIDFTDDANQNDLIKISKETLVYKNNSGGTITVLTENITRLYETNFDFFKLILLIVGIFVGAFLALIIAIASSGGFRIAGG